MLINCSTGNSDFDYVEGSFPSPQRPEKQPFAGAGFDDDSFDTSGLFNHHFGGFFGGDGFNPFGNFGGIGFGGPVQTYKPWYKG
jgi:hypothetical protein